MSIFKACDIRGAYPTELAEPLYADLGRAVGTVLRGQADRPSVLVAGDVRTSTPTLQAALIEGLTAAGCRVTDLGIAPTPLAYFAARRLRPDGLAIVTASHNPAGDNGLKLMLGPLPITLEQMGRVEQTLAARRFAAGCGSVTVQSFEADYIEWLCASAAPGGRLKLVLDCGNGTYSALAPRVLRRLGYRVVELFCTPDGTFPNRAPNPSVPEHLSALCDAVPRAGAALGVALDGDGDRVAVVDDAGRALTGDQSIMLLAQHVLDPARSAAFRPRASDGEAEKIRAEARSADRVVLDLKCSKAVADVVAACGAVPLLERSGHTFIKTRMIAENARFGGEVSGHFFYRELEGGDDGLYSVLRLAELARQSERPVSALVNALPHYAITPDIRVRYKAADGPQRLEQLAAAATGDVLRLDGVRIAYPDGWALARCSVTEPLLTFRFEAYAGSPRAIAERFLAPAPDLLRAVLSRLDALDNA
ncbi:MAG TPA: phosphomannomutase/phosphoglucomutase [Planctomycetota bacterium]|nr:phosphomannomutase/phosphoglucomutase [Planctomycetota bacterium]HRR80821.1 phosphomannomutase/phosphoglucomutase [Planctomycetota bacterium]HRT96429.1 phosphomannomutase/phosphoglucomutase [Planctomycetota bacterium]